jgi:hypothetical protein
VFMCGLRKLVVGLAADKTTLTICMDPEEAWIREHIGDGDFDFQKQVLASFANDVCEWGREVQSTMSGRQEMV